MNYDEFSKSINQAEFTMSLADRWASKLAHLLVGRLRQVDGYTLTKLKRELKQFNATTKRWDDA